MQPITTTQGSPRTITTDSSLRNDPSSVYIRISAGDQALDALLTDRETIQLIHQLIEQLQISDDNKAIQNDHR